MYTHRAHVLILQGHNAQVSQYPNLTEGAIMLKRKCLKRMFVSVLGEDGGLNQNVGVEVLKKMGLVEFVDVME